MKNSAIERIYM